MSNYDPTPHKNPHRRKVKPRRKKHKRKRGLLPGIYTWNQSQHGGRGPDNA